MFCRVEPRPRDAVKGRMLEFLQWRELLCSCNFANKGCHPQRVSDLLRGALHHPCMERCDSTGFSVSGRLGKTKLLSSTCEGFF